MTSVFTSITSAIDCAAKLNDLIQKLNNAELLLAMSELQLALAAAKREVASLTTQSDELRRQLNDVLKAKEDVVFRDGLYWKTSGDGPFCTGCYDSRNNKLVRVTTVPDVFSSMGKWQCPSCRAMYT